jgi:pimeloyl-ACP methyl ester carboxylesterase
MPSLTTTQPFHIGIPQETLDDLRMRLERARYARVFPPQLRKPGWNGGSDPDYLQELMRYWRDEYDWRRQERELNLQSHYIASIDEARVHYVHEAGRGAHPTPLLLLHGWPDSFLRYRRAIPHLIDAELDNLREPTFDVVVPSLPGFAFTGILPPAAVIPGIASSARLLHRLMTEVLGYPKFMVAGGDGGSAIAQSMAIQFPASIIGVHLTDIGWQGDAPTDSLTSVERKYLEAAKRRFMEDGAYVGVHATLPRALAAGLNDSPLGLASWIIDRFHSWADSPRHFEEGFGRDELLNNISIYWFTQTIQSSIYGYLAETRQPSLGARDFVDQPVGLALFPRDLAGPPPRRLAERTLNVVRWTEMTGGGHFGAWERPREYAADLKNFMASLEDLLLTQDTNGQRARPGL